MFQLFSNVYPYIKFRDHKIKRANDYVFQLHYRVTFGILLVCTILVSSYEYIDSSGSAIQCFMDRGISVPEQVINRYCWIQSTFTLPSLQESEAVLRNNPGVGAILEDEPIRYHAYYQWVPLFLFMQAIFFYFPHWLWKIMEGGRLKSLASQLEEAKDDKEKTNDRYYGIAEYFSLQMVDQWEHRIWALKYCFCESLNFVNVIFQMNLTNTFLRGEFSSYGSQAFGSMFEDPEYRSDPMSKVFPKVTKCTFQMYGSSGTLQKMDAFCVLGMNILNEKIFVFLWFWFWFLVIVNLGNLLMRIANFFFTQTRYNRPTTTNLKRLTFKNKFEKHSSILDKMSFSDWVIFSHLARAVGKDAINVILDGIALQTQPHTLEMTEMESENDTLKMK